MVLPKTVIIGANGFIGKYFLKEYRRVYPDCIATSRIKGEKGTSFLDLFSPSITSLRLSESGHKQALILAGITKIFICEQEQERTRKINVEGTLNLIEQLVKEGIKPIFFSTDIIFDGIIGSYDEDTTPTPLNEYARQKVEVEAKLKDICKDEDYLIVRLSKTFSLERGDGTLFDEMASAFRLGKNIRAAYDQIFAPIFVLDVVKIVTILQMKNISGIVNINSPEVWSRYDLAVALGKCMKIDLDCIKRISLDELKESFGRPKNTSMKVEKMMRETNYQFVPILEYIKKIAESWQGVNV